MYYDKMERKGFTLIELLVVISIIALLLSIMMPALNQVKERARRVVCSAHLHNISLVLGVYASENNMKLPAGEGAVEAGWFGDVPYDVANLIRRDYGIETLYCPANNLRRKRDKELMDDYLSLMWSTTGNVDQPDDAEGGHMVSDYSWFMTFGASWREEDRGEWRYPDGTRNAGKNMFNSSVLNVNQSSSYPLVADMTLTEDDPDAGSQDFTNVRGGKYPSNHLMGGDAQGANILNCDGNVVWQKIKDLDMNHVFSNSSGTIYNYW